MDAIRSKDFKVTKPIKISKVPTTFKNKSDKDELQTRLTEISTKIAKIQEKMYAQGKYGVLIGLQGMDTSGKDSLIREVFKEFNVRGVVVHSFKQPTELELSHDYLWRHYLALPERGRFAIFNRTHYENVLVTRVHPEFNLAQNLPGINSVADIDKAFWKMRFEQIRNFENHLAQNGTIVLKFFLHLSKEEQRQRLLRRLEEEKHNWKFSPGDLKEREHWDEYQQCYEEAINETSTKQAPWFVIPADDKEMARVIFAEILLEALQQYKDIDEPELDDEVKDNISKYKKLLSEES
jgi:PPK2 family polyphosphate:nucleotide phosphotransferase